MTVRDIPLETAAATCSCGEHAAELPVLDVRQIPHAIRHGAVFGALEQVGAGGGVVLVAPHNPLPLLAQLGERYPLQVSYLDEGPAAWRLRIVRRG